MAYPSNDQIRDACLRWNREWQAVPIEITYHGVSDWRPLGIWCYYLYLHQNMFQRAEDFARFNLPYQTYKFNGKWYRHYPYDEVSDLEWHGGITFGERREGYDHFTAEPYTIIKLGCDYGHLWDEENGYWQGLEEVYADAKRSADALVAIAPMKVRCAYSGRIDMPDRFYTAINGAQVHVDAEIPIGWDNWRPAEPPAPPEQES